MKAQSAMLKKFFEIKNDKIVSNFFSLGILQLTNYLMPLVAMPFLLRTVGFERFGKIYFAQAVVSYFIILSEYGFGLTATRLISVSKNQIKTISTIFSETITVQIILSILAFFLLLLLVVAFPFFRKDTTLFLNSFTAVIGQILLVPWFFQGTEKMKFITYLNLASKGSSLIFLFLFVTKQSDYVLVPLIYSFGNIFSGIFGMIIIFRVFKVNYEFPLQSTIFTRLRQGFPVFISSLSVSAYLNSNLIILGFFSSETGLGLFALAERIMQVLRQLLVVFSQAVYPQVCILAKISKESLIGLYKKFYLPFLLLIVLSSSIIFLFSKDICVLIAGYESASASLLTKILIVSPVIVCLNIPFYQNLLANDFRTNYMMVILSGAIFNILINIILSSQYGAIGTAISVLATEFFVTTGMVLSMERLGPKYSFFK